MGPQVFQVLTEFRFDVAHALVGTQQVQGAVEGLSHAADSAIASFQRLGLAVIANFGVGYGGVAGSLYTALKASDKFAQSQLAFANTIADASVPFQDRMVMAEDTLKRINKLASEFALPTDELMSFTKVLGPMLRQKGLAGSNFHNAIDIGRNLLKSAPTLGVDPTLVQGQLLRMIEGQASMNDTLFTRLAGDTKNMRPYLGRSQAFNSLDAAKRVGVLQKALKEFASDANVLQGNVRTLRGQMQLLTDAFTGAFSVLKPIGDVLMKPVINGMETANKWLRKEGASIAQSFADIIEPWVQDPEKLGATVMQLSRLKSDLNMASRIMEVTGALLGLNWALNFVGIRIPIVTGLLHRFAAGVELLEASLSLKSLRELFSGRIVKALASLGPMIGNGIAAALRVVPKVFSLSTLRSAVSVFSSVWKVASGVVTVLSRIFVPLLLLVGVFQLVSRAIAIARINDAKKMLEVSPRIARALATFSRIFAVFNDGFDSIARLIAPAFEASNVLEPLVWILEALAAVATVVMSSLQGAVFVVMNVWGQMVDFIVDGVKYLLDQVKAFVPGGKSEGLPAPTFSFDKIGEAWDAGVDDMLDRILGKIADGSAVVNQTTNIAKVEIRNDFKENQQPDRVAFTIKEQILKAAKNPVQGRGRSMQGAFAQ